MRDIKLYDIIPSLIIMKAMCHGSKTALKSKDRDVISHLLVKKGFIVKMAVSPKNRQK